MDCVKSTTRLCDDTPTQEGEYAVTERGAIDEGHDSAKSVERTESVHASDAVSQSNVEGESNGDSRTYNCYFGPLTVTVSRIREMGD
jgi:hypothetical protein